MDTSIKDLDLAEEVKSEDSAVLQKPILGFLSILGVTVGVGNDEGSHAAGLNRNS